MLRSLFFFVRFFVLFQCFFNNLLLARSVVCTHPCRLCPLSVSCEWRPYGRCLRVKLYTIHDLIACAAMCKQWELNLDHEKPHRRHRSEKERKFMKRNNSWDHEVAGFKWIVSFRFRFSVLLHLNRLGGEVIKWRLAGWTWTCHRVHHTHLHTRYMWSLVDLEIELISAWHGIHNVPNLHRSFFARFVFGCDNLCPAVCQIAGRC